MSKNFEKLTQGFRKEPPILPRSKARKAAIFAAMDAFEEKKSHRSQGIGVLDRLKNTGNVLLETLTWRRSMRLNYTLAGGVSLAVLTLAVINTSYFQTRDTQLGDGVQPMRLEAKKNKDAPVKGEIQTRRQNKVKPAENRISPPALKEATDSEVNDTVISDRKMHSGAASKPVMAPATSGLLKRDLSRRVIEKDASRPAPALESGAIGYLVKKKQRVRAANKTAVDQINPRHYVDQGRDKFSDFTPNPLKLVSEVPVSTFSIDVDTASYAFTRASLNKGVLPQAQAVRVEELINYFSYAYKLPQSKAEPFKANVSVMPTPWNTKTKLLHIGIKGFELPKQSKPKANLVFLLDTSGSMNAPNKLPLLQNAFKLLLSTLAPDDSVAIVTYAGSAGMALAPTKAKNKNKILAALDNLQAGGSTAGAEGIRQAYQLAEQNFTKSGVNRVILATDGDFNVGITNRQELKSYIERKRNSGVYLSVLGFGTGNYNDALMQTLAQNGNGNAAYIDNLNEARKVLVSEAGSTLFTIAKDVKIQVEFNPDTLSEYRLIGYESRLLNREDFNNDKIDAGDIGSGHTVTAIYEITPKKSGGQLIDNLRYGQPAAERSKNASDEYAFVKIRYKHPKSDTSTLITTPVGAENEASLVSQAPNEARFAASVAAFGQLLRGGRHTGAFSYDDVIELALSARGEDRFGYRAEFINLVRLAKSAAAMKPLK